MCCRHPPDFMAASIYANRRKSQPFVGQKARFFDGERGVGRGGTVSCERGQEGIQIWAGQIVIRCGPMQAVNRFLRSLPVLRQIQGFGLQAEPIVIKTPGNVQAPRDREYDFGPYPNGWIQIAWSWELPPGQVRSLRCLGQEFVLFRGHDGKAHVLDAYCPHLGAHLGVGGTVVGNDIRCFFHGW